ncbi:hypothetical protein IFM89_032799, partial [Coptis chinensis]
VLVLMVLIPTVATEKAIVDFVFTRFNTDNGGRIHSSFCIFIICLLMSQYKLTGYDTSAHMLYYTKIGIETPSPDHYVHVDTGSEILWINCAGCKDCPKKSGLGICFFLAFNVHLKLNDPSSSVTGQLIYCDQPFCLANKNGPDPGCTSILRYGYYLQYGDGSSTAGYFVRDSVQYDQYIMLYRCGLRQMGNLDQLSTAVDGILGFGQSSNSMMSMMAAAGSMKKMFALCLDGTKVGGIFAMGNVVQPKVYMTPVTPTTTDPLPTPNPRFKEERPHLRSNNDLPAVFDT